MDTVLEHSTNENLDPNSQDPEAQREVQEDSEAQREVQEEDPPNRPCPPDTPVTAPVNIDISKFKWSDNLTFKDALELVTVLSLFGLGLGFIFGFILGFIVSVICNIIFGSTVIFYTLLIVTTLYFANVYNVFHSLKTKLKLE
jgi:hypothetical protein